MFISNRSLKMKKYSIYLLIATCYSIASAHILTSSYLNYPKPMCKKLLNHAMNTFCAAYNYESTDYLHEYSKDVDTSSWEYLEKVYNVCCTRPCTISELLSVCHMQLDY